MRIALPEAPGFIGSHVVDAYARGRPRGARDRFALGAWRRPARERPGGVALRPDGHSRRSDCGASLRSSNPRSSATTPRSIRSRSRRAIRSTTHKSTSSGCSTCSRRRSAGGARKVIFASSGATFGTPGAPSDHRCDAAAADVARTASRRWSPNTICASTENRSELDFTALRYGNVYGPRQDPNGEAGVI